MRQSLAPKGFYTEVDIQITLKGGRRHRREWDTALALAPAYHQAMKWIRDELKEGKVQGFTTIQRVQVDVKYVEGEFVDDNR